jgi:ParB/RepB/Spo0J family partition protein
MSDQIANISVDLIVPSFVLLRLVDKTSLDYAELRDSIKAHGFFSAICVRPSTRQPGKYEIINGVHRFCCALDCEFKDVPCIIKQDATDADVKNWQIQANLIVCETKTTDYAARIKMLFCEHPELTMEDIAAELHCRPSKLKDILRLNRLIPRAKEYVDHGDISITIAYALSKTPKKLQEDLLPSALTLPVRDFVQVCNGYIRAYKEAANQGRLSRYLVLDAAYAPHLRSFKQVKVEYEKLTAGKMLLENLQITDPIEIWKTALAWVLHIDKLSIQAAKERAEECAEVEQRKIERRRIDRAKFNNNRTKAKSLGISPDDDPDMTEIVAY